MKTKELIKRLQELDPEGDMEISIDNHDIYQVELHHAGENGMLSRIISNDNGRVIGAKVIDKGLKISLSYLTIEDLIWNDPDLPVQIDVASEEAREDWEEVISSIREEARAAILEIYEWSKAIDEEKKWSESLELILETDEG